MAIKKLVILSKYLRAFLPSRLPVGMKEFDDWAESFHEIYTMPTSNKDSVKFTLATIVMHLGSTIAYKSKFFFYLTIQASAAKQVAGTAFYDIKERQKAAELAAKDVTNETTIKTV